MNRQLVLIAIMSWHGTSICAMQKIHIVPTRCIQGDLILPQETCLRFTGYEQEPEKSKHTMWKILHEKVLDEQGNKLILFPNDILVEFWALSSTGIERLQISPKEFVPWFLPLSFFEGKKESDTVTFYYQDTEKNSCIKIVLTCRQLRDNTQRERFEDELAAMKLRFHGTPQYWPEDEELLEQAGLLQRLIDSTGNIIGYQHGKKSAHYDTALNRVPTIQEQPSQIVLPKSALSTILKTLTIRIPIVNSAIFWESIKRLKI